MSVFRNLLMKVSGWLGKPTDWSDIRKDCPANSIALYAGHTADYSQYDNLGFTATCVGGYNVFIDGVQYGSTYASGATCSITWSTSGITTGDDITTPSAMKAHKIWIQPATEGNDITRFQFKRVSGSVQEEQGCLWCHFNLNTSINLQRFSAEQNTVWQKLCEAITAKNNTIKFLQYGTGWLLRGMPNIKYIPVLDCNNTDAYFNYMASNLTNLTSITVKNANVVDADDAFSESINIESIKFVNVDTSSCSSLSEMFRQCRSLNKLPDLNLSSATIAFNFLTEAVALEDTILDVSSATALERIGCYGKSNYFMSGFKGLRVSNEAPFNNATAPQIDVSYTGMNRAALVQLFNDLPTVSDGQIINITGCTGSENLTDEDISIAENKGWTVAGGPAFQVYSTYNASVGDTIKLNDGMATSDYTWSAYPSDTATVGDYTQTATITAVNDDTIECQKPTQDNKNATIITDEDADIEIIDNTTAQTVTITTDQTAEIETSANVTTDNNDVVLTDGSYHLFNITVPQTMTAYIESNGSSLTPSDMPISLKNNAGIGLLLKNGNNVYYRNTWIINRDYDLHYQQINFSYPSGATVTCKVNNVAQSNLTPYVYAGDIVSWTCDNAGTITTGSYTVKYSSLDGNIQTITIS